MMLMGRAVFNIPTARGTCEDVCACVIVIVFVCVCVCLYIVHSSILCNGCHRHNNTQH